MNIKVTNGADVSFYRFRHMQVETIHPGSVNGNAAPAPGSTRREPGIEVELTAVSYIIRHRPGADGRKSTEEFHQPPQTMFMRLPRDGSIIEVLDHKMNPLPLPALTWPPQREEEEATP